MLRGLVFGSLTDLKSQTCSQDFYVLQKSIHLIRVKTRLTQSNNNCCNSKKNIYLSLYIRYSICMMRQIKVDWSRYPGSIKAQRKIIDPGCNSLVRRNRLVIYICFFSDVGIKYSSRKRVHNSYVQKTCFMIKRKLKSLENFKVTTTIYQGILIKVQSYFNLLLTIFFSAKMDFKHVVFWSLSSARFHIRHTSRIVRWIEE